MITPSGIQSAGASAAGFSSAQSTGSLAGAGGQGGGSVGLSRGSLASSSSGMPWRGSTGVTSASALGTRNNAVTRGEVRSAAAATGFRSATATSASATRITSASALRTGSGAASTWQGSRSGTTGSATVPGLTSASRITSTSFPVNQVVYYNQWPYYCHGGGFYYGHCGYPFYGFSFSLAFGYPYYCGYPYYSPYYYPYHSVCVRYPYYGYYFSYPYPYLAYYPYYDCDYYDGYYVRYGYYRQSYYVTCSGIGYHGLHDHHCHFFECGSHGSHCYHLRDCDQCYPSGDAYVDTPASSIPEVIPPSEEAVIPPADSSTSSTVASTAGGAPGTATAVVTPEVARVESAAASAPNDRAESFFASLKPAQLSFSMGLLQLRSARYDEAVESLYNASLEDPESKLVKVFLGISLFSIGEYGFAAEYLRAGLEEWPTFARFRWDVRQLYAAPADFDDQLATLQEDVRLHPAAADSVLVLAFLQMCRSNAAPERSGPVLDQGRALAVDELDRSILDRCIAELERRQAAAGAESGADPATQLEPGDAPVQTFLTSLELKDIPALPIR